MGDHLSSFLRAVLLAALGCCVLAAQDASGVTVYVRDAIGSPLGIPALVRLSGMNSPGGSTTTTGQGGAATFTVPGGQYTVEVTAITYQTAREEITVMSGFGMTPCYILLRREDDAANSQKQPPGVPSLVGKARKELDLAIAALRAGKPAEATRHMDYALKHAPGNPDVQYIAAFCDLNMKNPAGERKHLESAISIFPAHFGAQITLGELLLQQNDAAGAMPHLEKALSLDPNSWRGHWLLAEAFLRANPGFAKAKFHAGRAVELGREKATGARITRAIAEARAGNRDAARSALEQFLRDYPEDPGVPRARAILATAELSPPRSFPCAPRAPPAFWPRRRPSPWCPCPRV